jgi:hypothetical protein
LIKIVKATTIYEHYLGIMIVCRANTSSEPIIGFDISQISLTDVLGLIEVNTAVEHSSLLLARLHPTSE